MVCGSPREIARTQWLESVKTIAGSLANSGISNLKSPIQNPELVLEEIAGFELEVAIDQLTADLIGRRVQNQHAALF
jgi:H2-forming N5,N10-methylenetetrahydromethanopterin dehydrogenase-like enzyme